jgi:DNA (cytosine-5)-methyltransferase 1
VINCVDVFCGLGGLTHGLAKGGIKVVAGIDLDPECRFPYEENNDASFLEMDVQEVSGELLCALWGGEGYTLLAGCAPCQPFSTYGRKRDRHPDSKARWGLVKDFTRLIDESRPDLVTMENVPQLADHKVFSGLVSSMSEYRIWWDVIDCSDFEVPQTRKRLVLLASRLGPIRLGRVRRSLMNLTVRSAISHLKSLNAGEADPHDPLHAACRLSKLNLKRIKASSPGGTWRDWDDELLTQCHKKQSGETYPSVYGRMEWDKPAPTITTQSFGYGNGRFGHPEQDRAITLREAAMLQTFPDTYDFLPMDQKVRYSVLGRLIGNAVPVRLGQAIAHTFVKHVKRYGAQREGRPN